MYVRWLAWIFLGREADELSRGWGWVGWRLRWATLVYLGCLALSSSCNSLSLASNSSSSAVDPVSPAAPFSTPEDKVQIIDQWGQQVCPVVVIPHKGPLIQRQEKMVGSEKQVVEAWLEVDQTYTLAKGSALIIPQGSEARLQTHNGSLMTLSPAYPGTGEARVDEWNGAQNRITLLRGAIHVQENDAPFCQVQVVVMSVLAQGGNANYVAQVPAGAVETRRAQLVNLGDSPIELFSIADQQKPLRILPPQQAVSILGQDVRELSLTPARPEEEFADSQEFPLAFDQLILQRIADGLDITGEVNVDDLAGTNARPADPAHMSDSWYQQACRLALRTRQGEVSVRYPDQSPLTASASEASMLTPGTELTLTDPAEAEIYADGGGLIRLYSRPGEAAVLQMMQGKEYPYLQLLQGAAYILIAGAQEKCPVVVNAVGFPLRAKNAGPAAKTAYALYVPPQVSPTRPAQLISFVGELTLPEGTSLLIHRNSSLKPFLSASGLIVQECQALPLDRCDLLEVAPCLVAGGSAASCQLKPGPVRSQRWIGALRGVSLVFLKDHPIIPLTGIVLIYLAMLLALGSSFARARSVGWRIILLLVYIFSPLYCVLMFFPLALGIVLPSALFWIVFAGLALLLGPLAVVFGGGTWFFDRFGKITNAAQPALYHWIIQAPYYPLARLQWFVDWMADLLLGNLARWMIVLAPALHDSEPLFWLMGAFFKFWRRDGDVAFWLMIIAHQQLSPRLGDQAIGKLGAARRYQDLYLITQDLGLNGRLRMTAADVLAQGGRSGLAMRAYLTLTNETTLDAETRLRAAEQFLEVENRKKKR